MDQDQADKQAYFEQVYPDMMKRLNTRKNFAIHVIEGEKVTIAENEEICGQKEPKYIECANQKELDQFITSENQAERDIKNNLESNEMPMR